MGIRCSRTSCITYRICGDAGISAIIIIFVLVVACTHTTRNCPRKVGTYSIRWKHVLIPCGPYAVPYWFVCLLPVKTQLLINTVKRHLLTTKLHRDNYFFFIVFLLCLLHAVNDLKERWCYRGFT